MTKDYNPKEYHDKGRKFYWGKDLTEKQMAALRNGEIFTLLDKNERPIKKIFMDSYDKIREYGLRGK